MHFWIPLINFVSYIFFYITTLEYKEKDMQKEPKEKTFRTLKKKTIGSQKLKFAAEKKICVINKSEYYIFIFFSIY